MADHDQVDETVVAQDTPVDDEVQAEDVDQAVDESDEADDATEGEPSEEDFEEITWNGETKKLTKAELRELAQKGFDYTQKTQTTAEERELLRREREAVAFQSQASQQLDQHRAQILAIDHELQRFAGIDPVELARSNPAQYAELNARVQQLQGMRSHAVHALQQAHGEVTQRQQEAIEARTAREVEQLTRALPELADKAKAAAFDREAARVLQDGYGIAPQEISSVLNMFDHRAFLLLKDLVALKAAKATKPRPISSAPPPPSKVAGTSSTAPLNPNKLSTEDWMKWREKQLRKKGR